MGWGIRLVLAGEFLRRYDDAHSQLARASRNRNNGCANHYHRRTWSIYQG